MIDIELCCKPLLELQQLLLQELLAGLRVIDYHVAGSGFRAPFLQLQFPSDSLRLILSGSVQVLLQCNIIPVFGLLERPLVGRGITGSRADFKIILLNEELHL